MKPTLKSVCIWTATLCVVCAWRAGSTEYNWSGGSGNWNATGNWTPTGYPGQSGSDDIAVFDAATGRTVTLNISPTVDEIRAAGAGSWIWSGTETLTVDLLFSYSNTSVNVAAFAPVLDGTGALRIDAGSLALENAANTFNGGIYINAGLLRAGKKGLATGTIYPLGDAANPIYLGATGGEAADATLQVMLGGSQSASWVYPQPITVRAGNAGRATIEGGYTYYSDQQGYVGTVALEKDVLFRNDHYAGLYAFEFWTRSGLDANAISGTGNVTKEGPGRVIFRGSNSYTGTTTVAGGILTLRNTSTSNEGDYVVRNGTLLLMTNDVMGAVANKITLGGPGGLGGLAVAAYYAPGTFALSVPNDVRVEGVGGRLAVFLAENRIGLTGVVSGPGRMILVPGCRNNVFSFLDGQNTYSGGTIAAAGHVGILNSANYNKTVFGTGPVRVLHTGALQLRSANNIASDQPVSLEGGTLMLYADTALPTIINTNSSGIIMLAVNSGTTLNNRFADANNPIGNGNIWLSGYNNIFTGHSLAALVAGGSSKMYRLRSEWWSQANNYLTLDRTSSTTGALTDLNAEPHDVSTSGTVFLKDTNSFSGALYVSGNLYADIPQGVTSGSPLGSNNGTMRLDRCKLQIFNRNNGDRTVIKGETTFRGAATVIVNTYDATPDPVTTLELGSLVRDGRSTLAILTVLSPNLGLNERVIVSGGVATDHGMVDPYIWNSYGAFLNYDPTVGFTNVLYDATSLAAAGENDKVYLGSGDTVSVNQTIHALRANGPLLAGGGTLTISRGALLLSNNSMAHTAPLNFGSAEAVVYVVTSGQTHTYNGAISGSGGLTKSGPGTLTLGVANPGLSGEIHVIQGTLTTLADDRFGSASITLHGGALSRTGTGATACDKNIYLAALGGTLSAGTFNGVFSGPGRIGASSVTLNGASEHLGGVSVGGGATLTCGVNARLGSGSVYVGNTHTGNTTLRCLGDNNTDGNAVTIDTMNQTSRRSIVQYESVNPKCGSLAGYGLVTLGTASVDSTLYLGGNNASTEFFGYIVDYDSEQSNSLVKEGDGTFTLWGEGWYKGGTEVAGGTLVVNNWINPAGTVVVKAGATLDGEGTVGLVDNQGGTVKGNLVTAGLTYGANSTLHVALNGTGANDAVSVNGPVTLNGGAVSIDLNFLPAMGEAFTIIANDGTDPVAGTFDSEFIDVQYNGMQVRFQVVYNGGDGNDVLLMRGPLGTMIFVR